MDNEHAEAAAAEEPPQLVNMGLDEDSDSDNEDDDAAPEFEVVPAATPPGPPANVAVMSQGAEQAAHATGRGQCQSRSNNGFDRSSEYAVPRAAVARSDGNQTSHRGCDHGGFHKQSSHEALPAAVFV